MGNSSQTEEYDIYVLSQSWLPSFCCIKPDRCPAFLDEKSAWAGNHLVLHGLWPTRANGEWPSNCQSKYNKYTAAKISERVPPLAAKFSPALKQAPEFALHEWRTHGSCSKLETPEVYFSESLRAHLGVPGKDMDRGTPKVLVAKPGEKVSSQLIRESYRKKIGLKCKNSCVLTEVITCYGRRPDNKAGEQSE